ncbi:MAG: hypothetical protein DRO65_03035 [Candidatus Altiarchaeales archaeon]|nr:MAG: hypothetical protein DRO65_03035 [Candidatus Altiarchaeales archaeon]
MIGKISFLVSVIFVALLSSVTFAIPGIPHQFYGKIYINNKLAPNNTVLTASIDGDNYSTITKNGLYGQKPAPIFYIPDPDGNRNGKTIQFFVNGKPAGNYTFENAGYTELNFSLDTFCGDGYCLGEENCSNCPADCGECPAEPLEITIHSPENNKTYHNPNIPLIVSSNKPVIVWMYSLNSEDFVIFTPNITIVAREGVNNLTVIGVGLYDEIDSETVTFSFELPPCGNGIKEWGEECDGNDFGNLTCQSYGYDSGTLKCSDKCTIITSGCYNSGWGSKGNSGSSGGGSSGGGGGDFGIGYVTPKNDSYKTNEGENISSTSQKEEKTICQENWSCTEWSECIEGIQSRKCIDLNNCGTTIHKPPTVRKCETKGENEKTEEDKNEYGKQLPTGRFLATHLVQISIFGTILAILAVIFIIYRKKSGKKPVI